MSGNTDFWHNDQFPQTSLISSGNFLFGADRIFVAPHPRLTFSYKQADYAARFFNQTTQLNGLNWLNKLKGLDLRFRFGQFNSCNNLTYLTN